MSADDIDWLTQYDIERPRTVGGKFLFDTRVNEFSWTPTVLETALLSLIKHPSQSETKEHNLGILRIAHDRCRSSFALSTQDFLKLILDGEAEKLESGFGNPALMEQYDKTISALEKLNFKNLTETQAVRIQVFINKYSNDDMMY